MNRIRVVPFTQDAGGVGAEQAGERLDVRAGDGIARIDHQADTPLRDPCGIDDGIEVEVEEVVDLDVFANSIPKLSGLEHAPQFLQFVPGHRIRPAAELETVVLGRIVTGGDRHATIDIQSQSRPVQSTGRHDPDVMHIHAAGQQPLDEGGVQFRPRLSNVATDRQRIAVEVCGGRTSQTQRERGGQRVACNSANVVGLEHRTGGFGVQFFGPGRC